MGGTRLGGLKARDSNKAKYGEDYYVKIGRVGGKLGTTGGFYANRELARTAGALGGSRSKRRPKAKATVYTATYTVTAPIPKKHWWDIKR